MRTVTLDGVVPPGLALGPGVAIDGQRALDNLLARCAAAPACAEQYPELGQRLAELLARLRTSPAIIEVPHPRTGAAATLTLTDYLVAGMVRLLTYSPQTAAMIPMLVRAAAEGDYGPLAAQVLMVSEDLHGAISFGMHFAVVCTEDVPFWGRFGQGGPGGDFSRYRTGRRARTDLRIVAPRLHRRQLRQSGSKPPCR